MNKYRAISLRKWRLMSISLFTSIFLLVYGPSFLAYASANTSYILLNRSMATADVAAPASTLKALEQAARKNPKVDSAIWRALGHVYALQNNESEAINAWKEAQNEINIVKEMYHWASVSEQQGDAQGAWHWYERAIALDSQTADTWYFAARFLEEEGDAERAASYYQNGLNTGRFHEVGVGDIALRLGRLAFSAQAWTDSDHWLNLALAASDFRLAVAPGKPITSAGNPGGYVETWQRPCPILHGWLPTTLIIIGRTSAWRRRAGWRKPTQGKPRRCCYELLTSTQIKSGLTKSWATYTLTNSVHRLPARCTVWRWRATLTTKSFNTLYKS
jgi:hypothetical protein